MTEENYEFEVAFSFLAEDEPLATSIADELRERMRVFIYSERQKDLAGKDGVEQFSKVFRERARVCVVLYRDGWGHTKWTRVEETAIKERAFDVGWDFLVVVALNSDKSPAWLPKTKIWLGYERFGLKGAAGVIDARVQEAGALVHEEGARDKAARLARTAQKQIEREKFLQSTEAVDAAHESLAEIMKHLQEEIAAIKQMPGAPRVVFAARNNRIFLVQGPQRTFTMAFEQQFANTLRYSSLIIKEFRGLYSFDGWNKDFTVLRTVTAYFDLDDAGLTAWREDSTPGRYYTAKQLGDKYLKRVLENR
jgi:hypothetical protein